MFAILLRSAENIEFFSYYSKKYENVTLNDVKVERTLPPTENPGGDATNIVHVNPLPRPPEGNNEQGSGGEIGDAQPAPSHLEGNPAGDQTNIGNSGGVTTNTGQDSGDRGPTQTSSGREPGSDTTNIVRDKPPRPPRRDKKSGGDTRTTGSGSDDRAVTTLPPAGGSPEDGTPSNPEGNTGIFESLGRKIISTEENQYTFQSEKEENPLIFDDGEKIYVPRGPASHKKRPLYIKKTKVKPWRW